MTTEEITEQQQDNPNQLMRQALEHFNVAMGQRTEMHLRVAKRVTYILRGLSIGVGVILLVVFFLLRALSSHNQDLIHTVDTMNINMASMTVDMGQMRQVMRSMDEYVATMKIINQEIASMQGNVSSMNGSIGTLSGAMSSIDQNMSVMTQDISRMTQTFAAMEHTVRGIGNNVNQMADPMKPWGSFLPFR